MGLWLALHLLVALCFAIVDGPVAWFPLLLWASPALLLFAFVIPQRYEFRSDELVVKRGLRTAAFAYDDLAKSARISGDFMYTVELETQAGRSMLIAPESPQRFIDELCQRLPRPQDCREPAHSPAYNRSDYWELSPVDWLTSYSPSDRGG